MKAELKPKSPYNKRDFLLRAVRSYWKEAGTRETLAIIEEYLSKLDDPYGLRGYIDED